MAQNKCLYSELGVSKEATVEEIKTAFRKLALAHHPDRHADLTEGQKTIESDRFKRISAAYQVPDNLY
jgi:DnaJ-class molecular chaperone